MVPTSLAMQRTAEMLHAAAMRLALRRMMPLPRLGPAARPSTIRLRRMTELQWRPLMRRRRLPLTPQRGY